MSNLQEQLITLSPSDAGPNLHAILWPTLAGSLVLGLLLLLSWHRWGGGGGLCCRRRAGHGHGMPPATDGFVGIRWEALGGPAVVGGGGKEPTSPTPGLPLSIPSGMVGVQLSDLAAPGGPASARHRCALPMPNLPMTCPCRPLRAHTQLRSSGCWSCSASCAGHCVCLPRACPDRSRGAALLPGQTCSVLILILSSPLPSPCLPAGRGVTSPA